MPTWPTPLADPDPADLELADDLIDDLRSVKGRAMSVNHRRNTRYTVVAFARWLAARGTGLFAATGADCKEWFADRAGTVGPNTQISNWVQLCAFYRNAAADDVADPLKGRSSPMARVSQPAAPKYARTKAARLEEYETLLEAFDKRTGLGLRNAAICSLMFRSALRVGELAQLDLASVDLEQRRVDITWTKNGDPRTAPLHPETMTLLRRYLRRRGDRPGPLFVNDGPRRASDRMRTASIQTMFKRAAVRAGVALTPHTLRRGWLGEYMAHGGDVVTAMTIAGWSREVMPHRYLADRRVETAQVVFDEVAQRQTRRRQGLRAVR